MIDCFIVLLKPTCGRKSYNRTDYYGTLKNEKYCSSFYFFSSFWVQFVVNYTWSEKPHCKLIFYQCFLYLFYWTIWTKLFGQCNCASDTVNDHYVFHFYELASTRSVLRHAPTLEWSNLPSFKKLNTKKLETWNQIRPIYVYIVNTNTIFHLSFRNITWIFLIYIFLIANFKKLTFNWHICCMVSVTGYFLIYSHLHLCQYP